MNIIFKNQAFGRLIAGQFASVMGDGLYLIAIIWWVKNTTGQDSKVALFSLCAVLPAVLFGILGGALTDRFNQKRIMISMDLLRAGLLLALAASAWAGFLSYALVCVLTVGLSAASAFFRPGLGVAVVDLVPKEQLPMANAANQTALALAGLVGPAVGGLVMAHAGLLPAILLNAATFLISAIFLQSLSLPPHAAPNARKHLGAEIADGFRYLAGQPFLLLLLVTFCVLNFVIAPLPVMLPALTRDVLHTGASGYGLLEAVITGGAIVGGILAGLVRPRQLTQGLVIQVVFAGLCLVLISVSTQLFVVAALLLCTGAGFAISNTLVGVLLQTEVPRELLGRVFGIVGTLSLALRPLALLVLVPLIHYAPSPASVFIFSGVAMLILGAAVFSFSAFLGRKATRPLVHSTD